MLGLAVLEMARFVLCERAAAELVRTLPEAFRNRRNQRILLRVADGGECAGLAAPIRKETIRLHRQGL
jgi:hypothetical protein